MDATPIVADATPPTSSIPLAVPTSTSSPPRTPRPARTPVLVVLHADGYVEAFGPDDVAITIASLPDVSGADLEIAAEDYLAATLPREHREIYMPGNLRATELHRPPRPSDIARRDTLVELHRALVGIGGDRWAARRN